MSDVRGHGETERLSDEETEGRREGIDGETEGRD